MSAPSIINGRLCPVCRDVLRWMPSRNTMECPRYSPGDPGNDHACRPFRCADYYGCAGCPAIEKCEAFAEAEDL